MDQFPLPTAELGDEVATDWLKAALILNVLSQG
jgi:hypothetical protein